MPKRVVKFVLKVSMMFIDDCLIGALISATLLKSQSLTQSILAVLQEYLIKCLVIENYFSNIKLEFEITTASNKNCEVLNRFSVQVQSLKI